MRSLIIEDDPANQFILKQFLAPYGQSSVASDGASGVELFCQALDKELPFDLVCIDIMMPGMDGLEALKQIRQEEASRGIVGLEGVKIIMASAVADSSTVIKSFREGCEAYLIKPLNHEDLVRNLRTLKLIPQGD